MSTSFAYTGSPPYDATFTFVNVNNTTTRGKPPRDALFSNLAITGSNPDDLAISGAYIRRDLGVSNLAVTGIINGTVHGNGATVIGRL